MSRDNWSNTDKIDLRAKIGLKVLFLMFKVLSPYQFASQFEKDIEAIKKGVRRVMSNKKIVYVKEHTAWSVVADTFTFASICASFWFNYKFIAGNNVLDVLLFICFFMFSVGKAAQIKRLTEEDK